MAVEKNRGFKIKSCGSSYLGGGFYFCVPTPPSQGITAKNEIILYAEYIMRNTGLDEAQAGIKIASRNISNLRYGHDTTLMADRAELGKTGIRGSSGLSRSSGYKLAENHGGLEILVQL